MAAGSPCAGTAQVLGQASGSSAVLYSNCECSVDVRPPAQLPLTLLPPRIDLQMAALACSV